MLSWWQITLGLENVALLETNGFPVVYGDWLHAPGKPTVLIYGHYDVQLVSEKEWTIPPFEPEIRDGFLYGRGATDNKGQLFLHLKTLETLLTVYGGLPVNIKICIEREEEIGSPHMKEIILSHREKWSADVVVISDTAMLGASTPGVCYGLRGLASFRLDVFGPGRIFILEAFSTGLSKIPTML